MLKRVMLLILTIALSFSLLVSCESEKTFSHAELSIVLDSSFEVYESEQYDLLLDNEDMNIGIKRISLYAASTSGIPDNYSPERFAKYVLDERGEDAKIFTYKDIPYFSLYETLSGVEFYTLYTFYRSKHAYFIISFAALKSDEAEVREKFFEYADTVYFTA